MAYTSLIHDDWHAEAFRVGNAYQTVVNVGCDRVIGVTYSIAVGLAPLPGGTVEYYFYVVSLNETTGDLNQMWSGLDSTNILPKVQRGAILRAILHATSGLLNQVNPPSVSWCTWDRNLPDKALVKYSQIRKVFEACDYEVKAGEPHNGQYMWTAERLKPPTFPFDQVEGNER